MASRRWWSIESVFQNLERNNTQKKLETLKKSKDIELEEDKRKVITKQIVVTKENTCIWKDVC